MKVKTLINILKNFSPESEVIVETHHDLNEGRYKATKEYIYDEFGYCMISTSGKILVEEM